MLSLSFQPNKPARSSMTHGGTWGWCSRFGLFHSRLKFAAALADVERHCDRNNDLNDRHGGGGQRGRGDALHAPEAAHRTSALLCVWLERSGSILALGGVAAVRSFATAAARGILGGRTTHLSGTAADAAAAAGSSPSAHSAGCALRSEQTANTNGGASSSGSGGGEGCGSGGEGGPSSLFTRTAAMRVLELCARDPALRLDCLIPYPPGTTQGGAIPDLYLHSGEVWSRELAVRF